MTGRIQGAWPECCEARRQPALWLGDWVRISTAGEAGAVWRVPTSERFSAISEAVQFALIAEYAEAATVGKVIPLAPVQTAGSRL